jgi:hypothetical protein
MSALGQKQTSRSQPVMSALPPKADIAGRQLDVRFVPETDQVRCSKFRPIRSPRRRRSTATWHVEAQRLGGSEVDD